MGKYLSLANEYVQQSKPIIEKRAGMNLGKIVIKAMKTLPDSEIKKHQIDTKCHAMFMLPGFRHSDTIYMNEELFDRMQKAPENIFISVNHELSHLVQDVLFEEELTKLESRSYKTWIDRKYYRIRPFREGFAEYMSLDHLTRLTTLYDFSTLLEVIEDSRRFGSYVDFFPGLKPYERGYKFFRKVLSVIGKDKLFEVARAPPISEIEMRIPLLYLLRKYPAKGIKNIPKFLTKGIKAKILKRINGYAPLEF